MKKALISPNELIDTSYRIVDVAIAEFPVAAPLFWIDCDDTVTSDGYTYNPTTKALMQKMVIAPVLGAPDPVLHAATNARQLILAAKAKLADTDTVIIRCYEHTVPVPAEWTTYRNALRAIVSGADTTSKTLPVQPAYPAGT